MVSVKDVADNTTWLKLLEADKLRQERELKVARSVFNIASEDYKQLWTL